MTFEPQSDVQYAVVPVDITEQVGSGGAREAGLLAIPTGNAWTVEVTKIGIFQEVLHVPDSGAVTVDIEFWDSLRTGQLQIDDADDFTVTGVQEDRTFDADTMVEQEIANVFGTFVQDLQRGAPIPQYNISNLTTDRIWDANSTTDAELADVLGTLIRDVERGWGGFFNVSNLATDRTMNATDPPANAEMADLIGNLAQDLQPRSNLIAGVNLLVANHTLRQLNEIWQGSQIMHQGDTLNAEIAAQGTGTQGLGASFVVEYRVLARS